MAVVQPALFHLFGGRLGDNRDWPAIDAWTASIGAALGAPAPHPGG